MHTYITYCLGTVHRLLNTHLFSRNHGTLHQLNCALGRRRRRRVRYYTAPASPTVTPCQLEPMPAVQPKQWLSLAIFRFSSSALVPMSNTVSPPLDASANRKNVVPF